MIETREIRHGHMCCSIGAGAMGFNMGNARVGNMRAKFRCVGDIDVVEMYEKGATQEEIGRALGLDQTSVSRLMRKHGMRRRPAQYTETHGMGSTAEYRAWQQMKNRCLNPNFTSYPNYGGRGVKVCDRWLNSFENFLADLGPRPSSKHSLDRFPRCDGDYEPGNCRWATFEEQQQNRNDNVLTPELVRQIRRSNESSSSIARRLGISISAAGKAKTGRSWRNVGDAS